jgi:hypothetical protein
VEWPQVRRRDEKKYVGLWAHNEAHYRDGGKVTIETNYCPLRKGTNFPVQIRVTRTITSVNLETSGGEHTQELCDSKDTSKFLNVKQRTCPGLDGGRALQLGDKPSPETPPPSRRKDTSAESAPVSRRREGRAGPLSQPPPASARMIEEEECFLPSTVKVLHIDNNDIVCLFY